MARRHPRSAFERPGGGRGRSSGGKHAVDLRAHRAARRSRPPRTPTGGSSSTHDCDLLNRDLEKEPWVEFLRGSTPGARKPDRSLVPGRNPRRIQVEAISGTDTLLLEVSVHDRFLTPPGIPGRPYFRPGKEAGEGCPLRFLVQWVARRYVRAALPDAFNERIRPIHCGLSAFFDRHERSLPEVFIRVEPMTELPPDSPTDVPWHWSPRRVGIIRSGMKMED